MFLSSDSPQKENASKQKNTTNRPSLYKRDKENEVNRKDIEVLGATDDNIQYQPDESLPSLRKLDIMQHEHPHLDASMRSHPI